MKERKMRHAQHQYNGKRQGAACCCAQSRKLDEAHGSCGTMEKYRTKKLVLKTLLKRGRINLRKVVAKFDLNPALVKRMVKKLEGKGIVARVEHAQSGHAAVFTLLEGAGLARLQQKMAQYRKGNPGHGHAGKAGLEETAGKEKRHRRGKVFRYGEGGVLPCQQEVGSRNKAHTGHHRHVLKKLVVKALAHRGAMTVEELARRLGEKPERLVRVVAKLERKGVVAPNQPEADTPRYILQAAW